MIEDLYWPPVMIGLPQNHIIEKHIELAKQQVSEFISNQPSITEIEDVDGYIDALSRDAEVYIIAFNYPTPAEFGRKCKNVERKLFKLLDDLNEIENLGPGLIYALSDHRGYYPNTHTPPIDIRGTNPQEHLIRAVQLLEVIQNNTRQYITAGRRKDQAAEDFCVKLKTHYEKYTGNRATTTKEVGFYEIAIELFSICQRKKRKDIAARVSNAIKGVQFAEVINEQGYIESHFTKGLNQNDD